MYLILRHFCVLPWVFLDSPPESLQCMYVMQAYSIPLAASALPASSYPEVQSTHILCGNPITLPVGPHTYKPKRLQADTHLCGPSLALRKNKASFALINYRAVDSIQPPLHGSHVEAV